MSKALIYGGSGGIGFATAEILKNQGWDLHLAGRNQNTLEKAAGKLQCTYTVGDAADPGFFTRATSDAGDFKAMIYAIGTINLKSLNRLSAEDYDRDFHINARGAALAAAAGTPVLKRNENASMVFFTSVAAEQGFSNHASVAMAKGAVRGLTLALAAELAPKIRVNALAPSLTNTPLAASLVTNPQMEQAIAGMHPIPRLGTAADIAAAAAFLVSDQAGWVTGQIWGIDGGRSSLRIKS